MLALIFDYSWSLAIGLFLVIFAALEIGYRRAQRTQVNCNEQQHEQVVNLREAMLLLLSFVVGFTFSMALTRYDQRSALVISEANAIHAASLRVGMLPEDRQGELLDLLRQYADSRRRLYDAGFNRQQIQSALDEGTQLQGRLWAATVAIGSQDRSAVFAEFMESLNQTIALDSERRSAMENRIPLVVWCLILFITLLSAFTAGYSLHRRFWFTTLVLPLTFAVVISLIADLDAPYSGFTGSGHEATLRLQQELRRGK
jgi:hypothetical protein